MKNRTKFIIGVLILLTIVLVIEYRMPRRFEWVATFSHTDPQPFGSMVFDSVMEASMPQGYEVRKSTIWQMQHDSTFATPKSLLIVTQDNLDDSNADALLQLASEGHIVMLATNRLYGWEDTLDMSCYWKSEFRLEEVAGQLPTKGLLRWIPKDDAYAGHAIDVPVYEQLVSYTLNPGDSVPCEPLLKYVEIEQDGDSVVQDESVIAVSYPIGKGELILVSTPLLFTNYMMVSGDGNVVIGRLMDRLKKYSVIRTESFVDATAQTESSPFYVFLKEPPLRWAIYLTVLAIILFCIFTARRRQRAIPVIEKPQNRNLEFVRLIGTLYWQEHWNPGLLAKKLSYTAEEIRRQTGVDIMSQSSDLRLLSRHTGIDEQELQFVLQGIREAASGQFAVSDAELKSYINELNRIQQSL